MDWTWVQIDASPGLSHLSDHPTWPPISWAILWLCLYDLHVIPFCPDIFFTSLGTSICVLSIFIRRTMHSWGAQFSSWTYLFFFLYQFVSISPDVVNLMFHFYYKPLGLAYICNFHTSVDNDCRQREIGDQTSKINIGLGFANPKCWMLASTASTSNAMSLLFMLTRPWWLGLLLY